MTFSLQACERDMQCGVGMCCAVSLWLRGLRMCVPRGDEGEECHPFSHKVGQQTCSLSLSSASSTSLAHFTPCSCSLTNACTQIHRHAQTHTHTCKYNTPDSHTHPHLNALLTEAKIASSTGTLTEALGKLLITAAAIDQGPARTLHQRLIVCRETAMMQYVITTADT